MASFSQWLPALPDNALTGDIIILGYLLAIVVNLIVNLIVILLLLFGKLRAAGIPVWLLVVNLIFFIVQIVLFYLNHHLH